MKCKVCGYEFDSGREYCPMCGSKVPEEIKRKEEEEMSWNTYDFPKPKKPEDIEMHWPSMNARPDGSVSVMKKDASEGFVRAADPAPAKAEPPKKEEAPMPDPWASMRNEFPQPAAQPQPVPVQPPVYQMPPVQQPVAPQPAPVQPQPVQQPVQPQPAPVQQPAAPQPGAWQMPQMQETPSWTPYNVQAPQQTMQMPPIAPGYAPSSFTQAYGAQYAQAQQSMQAQQPVQPVSPYTQPQTAWTIPPQPQPGQQVFVTQPAQPVYIQPAYPPVYPAYTQPMAPQATAPQQPVPPVQPEPAPAPQPEPEPAPAPQPEPPVEAPTEPAAEPMPEPAPERPEPVLEENVVASIDAPAPVQPEPQAEEEPFEENRDPQRFFTFNKKNEEFQQLLNQQYERLRNLRTSDDTEDFSLTSIYRKDTFRPTPAQDFFFSDELSSDMSEFEKMLLESTKEAEGDETIAINREKIKGTGMRAEDLIEPLPGMTDEKTEPIEPAEPETPAEPEIPKTKEEIAKEEHVKRLRAMAEARARYFEELSRMTAEQRAIKDAQFKADLAKEATITPEMVARGKAPEAEPAKEPEKVPEKTPEQIAAEEAAEREAAIERAKAEMLAAQEAQKKEQEAADEAEELDRALQQAEAPAADEKPEPAAEPAAKAEPEAPKKEPEEEAPERDKTDVFNEILDDVDEENEEREKREHSHWFLKFLLALLIVIAAAEGGTVALRHYAPDSPASIITTGIEQNVIQFVETGIDALKAKFHKEEAQPETPEEPEEPTETDTSFVLSDLIAQYNKNIEDVVENLAIGYDPQRSYDIAGLSSSELVTDAAEKAAVCKTLISYNSSWIDFINGVSQDCLDYLKADGTAYRSAVTFDKIGQITETFKKLEIGEIRKTGDTYFAFAGESIEVTQDETTSPSSGFMIYEMVPVGDDLKIKDYYNITN